jgi:spore photoproduct lyase
MAWISIGSLRFNPEMKRSMESYYPRSRATSAEMVLGDDGKVRYIKPLRKEMYAVLRAALRAAGAADVFTYLCMERPDMWEHIFGQTPPSTRHMDFAMAQSLHRRFPGMVPQPPRPEHYDAVPAVLIEGEPFPAASAACAASTGEG